MDQIIHYYIFYFDKQSFDLETGFYIVLYYVYCMVVLLFELEKYNMSQLLFWNSENSFKIKISIMVLHFKYFNIVYLLADHGSNYKLLYCILINKVWDWKRAFILFSITAIVRLSCY